MAILAATMNLILWHAAENPLIYYWIAGLFAGIAIFMGGMWTSAMIRQTQSARGIRTLLRKWQVKRSAGIEPARQTGTSVHFH